MTEKRMVHEYSSLTGLVVREETEADRMFAAGMKGHVEQLLANGGQKGWSIPVSKDIYAALKRHINPWQPKPGDLVAIDEARGPYRRGRRP